MNIAVDIQKEITIKATTSEEIEMLHIMAIWTLDKLKKLNLRDPQLKVGKPDNVAVYAGEFEDFLVEVINKCNN